MSELITELRQLKERSANLIVKLKQPSEQMAQLIANHKREPALPDSTNELIQSLLASRAPFDELLRRLATRQKMIEDIEQRRNSKANN